MEKSGILSQSQELIERIKHHRWSLGLIGAASALGMATAIAVTAVDEQPADIKTVVEKLPIQANSSISPDDGMFLREERILQGDTPGNLLTRLGIQEPGTLEFIRTSRDTRQIHQQLAPGKNVVAKTTENGELHYLHFPLNGGDSALVVEKVGGKLVAGEKALRYEIHVAMKSAEIKSSLFGATDAAGIPDGIANQIAEIFGGDIDFHRDLQKGDRFAVIYEMQYLNGQPARSGLILAAEFVNAGKVFKAIHFDQEGRSGYYTPEGKSLRKVFLRSPLEFSRVTSGFAMRFHPILQQWRATRESTTAHRPAPEFAPPGMEL